MGDEIALLRQQLQQSQAENLALKRQQHHLIRTQSNNVFVPSQRIEALVRSQSSTGYGSSVGHHYGSHSPNSAVGLSRAYSQQSPTSMSRVSNGRLDSMPFRQTGPVSPLESQPLCRSASDQARPSYRPSHQNLANIQEHDVLPGVGMSPAEFLSSFQDHDETYLATTRPLAPNDIQYLQNPSACPSMYSGVSALDANSPMTRQNSSFENGPGWGADMSHAVSSQSMFTPGSEHLLFPGGHCYSQSPDASQKHTSVPNPDFLGLGANLQDASPLSSYESSGLDASLTSDLSISMERTGSNESSSSTRSIESNLERRAKERHRQVLENGKRDIVAKPQVLDDLAVLAPKKKSGVVPTKATTYQRRKQPRVFCNKCKEHPGGFRGYHELQRHTSAKHSAEVVKFVCRDPASVGLQSNVTPKVPLKGCKSCDSGKRYGAYYNAAAHLRRTHFVPRLVRGKGKGGDERRGGKAGGNWPVMEDLKLWYEKITVVSDTNVVSPSDEAESLDEEDEELEDAELDTDELEPEPMAEAQHASSDLSDIAAAMSANAVDWSAIGQPGLSIPDSQPFMPGTFAGNISLDNSPANLSYTEDNSPPMWGAAVPGSFASPALEFLSQDSPVLDFQAYA